MIFLHGANSGAAEVKPFVDAMKSFTPVHTPNWLGHGGRPLPPALTLRSLADDVVAWMDSQGIERGVVGGYSLGGTVALLVARHHPQRVSGVVALATKHIFDAATIDHWKYLASRKRVEGIRVDGVTRVEQLTKLHAPNDWKDVLDANARMFDTFAAEPPLSAADLAAIHAPVIVLSSNLDQIVPWAETLALGRALPRAHVAMFPGHAHPLQVIPLLPVARTIDEWMRKNGLKA